MPRRKLVHPQPLKRSSEEGTEESPDKVMPKVNQSRKRRQTDESEKPSPEGNTTEKVVPIIEPPSPSPPKQGAKLTPRSTRSLKAKPPTMESTDRTPPEEAASSSMSEKGDAGSVGSDGNPRNLSLEALFQVTHSELENISRGKDSTEESPDNSVNKEPDEKKDVKVEEEELMDESVTRPVKTPSPALPVSEISDVIVKSQASEETVSTQRTESEELVSEDQADDSSISSASAQTSIKALQICVEIPELSSEGVDEAEMVECSSPSSNPQTVVRLPVSEKGVEKYQLKSETLEEQGLKLIYTKKTYDQYEPNPISYGTYKPRSYKATSQVVDPALQESGVIQVGRKRKHPPKPGRHMCPYCGRGCAKPSVLQKHIRAHTGERPYPCIPCGFAFKTKSNLYKHCKSRAHANKAGLTPNVDDPSKGDGSVKMRDDSLEGDMDDVDSEDTDGESHEDDGMSDSSALELSKSGSIDTMDSPATGVVEVVQATPKTSEPVIIELLTPSPSGNSQDQNEGQTSQVASQDGRAKVQVLEGHGSLIRTPRLIKTDKQYYDIAYISQESPVLTSTPLIEASSMITVPQRDSLDIKHLPTLQSTGVPGPPHISLMASNPTVVSVTSKVEKESDNSMKVTIQLPKPPKGTEQVYGTSVSKVVMSSSATKAGQTGSVLRRSASLPDQLPHKAGKDGKGKSSEALRERLAQLHGVPPKPPDHKNMTPEMLRERITQLITDNAAIIDMPMADAPRPKRMSRQNSEVSAYRQDPGTPGAGTGPTRGLLQSSLSLDSQGPLLLQGQTGTKPVEFKIMEIPKGMTFIPSSQQETRFLGQAEPTDQPPGTPAESDIQGQKVAELVAAAMNATPVPPVALSAMPSTNSAPQEIKIQFKLAKLPADDATVVASSTPQPMIGQPGVQFPQHPIMLPRQMSLPHTHSADTSVIRDLLLKGRADKTLSKSDSTPVQLMEMGGESDVGQVVVVEGRGNPVTYYTQSAQELVPMHVAEDVEIMSSGETLRSAGNSPRAQLKRTMSLPQGIPAGSTSPSPYGSVIFDNYDPLVPPKRGRPKGSKNRPKEQSSLLGNVPITIATGSHSPAIYTSTMRMPLVAQTVTSPGVSQSRPPLRLSIPPPSVAPSANSAGVLGATGTPQAETPNSLWKLKLKGKLLMKRSMSVERMLSQERERQGVLDDSLPMTPSQSISSPLVLPSTFTTHTNPCSPLLTPFRRAESADEVTPLKKRRITFQSVFQAAVSEDSPMKRMLIREGSSEAFSCPVPLIPAVAKTRTSPLVTDNFPLVTHVSGSAPEEPQVNKTIHINSASDATNDRGIVEIPVHLSMSAPTRAAVPITSSHASVASSYLAPINQYQPINIQSLPFTAPFLQLGRQEGMQLPQSMYLSLKLSTTMSNIMLVRTPSDDQPGNKVLALEDSTKVPPLQSDGPEDASTCVMESTPGKELATESQENKTELQPATTTVTIPVTIAASSDHESITQTGPELTKETTVSLPSPGGLTTSSDSTLQTPPTSKPLALSDKGLVQVLLLGHQCPMLRMHTHSTFCTLAKPQPMYVPQEASRKLSMYSNWRVARYNPNPMGLSSRELMSLHHHRLRDNEPHFTSPTMGPSKTGILTHSSYWNYYNKMRELHPREEKNKGVDDVRIIKQVPEVKMATEVRITEEQDQIQKVAHHSALTIAMETTVVTTPALPKTKGKEQKRMRIFAGGYKTNEEYIYIRGRGRGKYVCEECGIRCKKPSMLKKHIRTHTDLRPYHCKHCSFSFKTKGNLTKHMKSKAHHKKCIELCILPVPITVEDKQIDFEALARQVALAKEGKWPSEDDGQFSDGDEDEDEDEDGDDSEGEEETMMIVDAETGQVKDTLRTGKFRSESEDEPQYVAIQEGGSSQPTLVQIDPKTQTTVVYQIETGPGPQVAVVATEGPQAAQVENDNPAESDEPRPSIDKEIAHSLLDLSKGNDSQKTTTASPLLRTISMETKRLIRQHSAAAVEEKKELKEIEDGGNAGENTEGPDGKGDGTRLDTLIGALMCRTGNQGDGPENAKNIGPDGDGSEAGILNKTGHLSAPLSMVRMATTIYQSASVRTSSEQPSTSDLLHIHRRSNNTYAKKIAALQSANENDLRMTLRRPAANTTGSGFVPPILLMGPDGEQRIVLESPMTPGSGAVPLIGHLLRRGSSEGTSSEKSDKPGTSSEHPINLSVRSDSSEDHSSEGIVEHQKVLPNTSSPCNTPVSSSVHYVTGENRAPFEIYPIAGKSRETTEALIDGKYICPICDKVFNQYSQFALHKNIHFFERPYRCEGCALSFRTKANLQKHQRSEMHQAKQSVNQQFGAPSSDNPRPYKCDECKVAFRIHGHLAKHFRSKSHITTMERLGKVAPGTSADSDLEVVEDDSSLDEDSQGIPCGDNSQKGKSDHPLTDPQNLLQPREMTPTSQIEGTTLSISRSLMPRKESSVSTIPRGVSPIQDQFHYHKLSGYEKDIHASNEKVTVEKIKSEPIDIGAICPLGTRTEVDPEHYVEHENEAAERAARNREVFRHQAGAGSGEQHPHKCGICGKTFRAMSVLKKHLVTHAELRPYVCEYCDAGFTTAQSLKFHLRTHTQERPYICGQCGDTFARSDHLRNHMHAHEDRTEKTTYPARPVLGGPQENTSVPVTTQVVQSTSGDVHLLERQARQGDERLVKQRSLQPEANTATQRRMAFSSSLSLPLSLSSQQPVKLVQLGQGPSQVALSSSQIAGQGASQVALSSSQKAGQMVPHIALTPTQIMRPQVGLMHMPVLSIPLQPRGQFPTMIAAPSPSNPQVQTLLLSSPMVLPTIVQDLTTLTTATATCCTGRSSSIATTTLTTANTMKCSVMAGPALIPTVVIDKEKEADKSVCNTIATTTVKPLVPRESYTDKEGAAPVVSIATEQTPVQLKLSAGAEVVSDPGVDVAEQREESNTDTDEHNHPVYVMGSNSDSMEDVITTKLVPPHRMQEELLQLLEQQGMSLDKVQLLQVKDSDNENLQLVIIECDDNTPESALEQAQSLNIRARQSSDLDIQPVSTAPSAFTTEVVTVETTTSQTSSDVATDKALLQNQPPPDNEPVAIETVSDTVSGRSEVKVNVNGLFAGSVEAHCQDIPSIPVVGEQTERLATRGSGHLSVPKDTSGVRQRGMLKRQHSVDIADQTLTESSLGNSSQDAMATGEAAEEPPAKVLVQQSQEGHCIPRPLTAADPKGQDVSD